MSSDVGCHEPLDHKGLQRTGTESGYHTNVLVMLIPLVELKACVFAQARIRSENTARADTEWYAITQ